MKAPLRGKARFESIDGEGEASLKTTVDESGVVTSRIGALGSAAFAMLPRALPRSRIFFQLYSTASAFTMRPLAGGRGSRPASRRSLPVIVRPSGATSRDSSRSPVTAESGSSPSARFDSFGLEKVLY